MRNIALAALAGIVAAMLSAPPAAAASCPRNGHRTAGECWAHTDALTWRFVAPR
jgi:hypothetical protein